MDLQLLIKRFGLVCFHLQVVAVKLLDLPVQGDSKWYTGTQRGSFQGLFITSNPKSKFSMISSKNSLCLPYLCFKIFGKKFVLPVQSLASQMVFTPLYVKTNNDNALMCSSATSRKSKICQYFQTFTNSVITRINAQR